MTVRGLFDVFGFRRSMACAGRGGKRYGPKGRQLDARRTSAIRSSSLEQLEDRRLLTLLTTLTSARLDMDISTTGNVTRVADHVGGAAYYSNATGVAFTKVLTGGAWYDCNSCSFAGGVLDFDFPTGAGGLDVKAAVQQGATNPYLVFTVSTPSPAALPDHVMLLNFTTTLTTYVSDFAGYAANDTFAIYARSLTPAGVVTARTFVDDITNHLYDPMVGAKLALGGCDYDASGNGVRTAIQTVITNEGLLTSSVGGPSALNAGINQESYVFASDLGEQNVQDWICLVKEQNVGIIFLSSWWTSNGHNAISPTKFPHGLTGMQSVVDQIHAAGLHVGLHTLTTAITSNDSYVTNTNDPINPGYGIPDSRLGRDATFTLSSAITGTGAATFTATLSGSAMPDFTNGGMYVRVDNELMLCSQVSNNGSTYTFTVDATGRGRYNTHAGVHATGASILHVYRRLGYFCPDPESTLMPEIATTLAATMNCGFDMVYLDGVDIAMDRYGQAKGGVEVFQQIDHAVRIEASAWEPYFWTFYSNVGAWDYPNWGDKTFIDSHCTSNYSNRLALLPEQLGWWGFRGASWDYDALMPDAMEYLCAKELGNGYSASYENLSPSTATNGRQDDYVAMIAKWQSIASTVDSSTKGLLDDAGKDFHLDTLGNGDQLMSQMNYAEHKVTSLTDGSQAWTVNNPYATQAPTIRIEALQGVGSYGTGQNLAGSSADVTAINATGIHRASSVSNASLTWASSPAGYPTGQSQSMCFTATNGTSSRTHTWAEASLIYSSGDSRCNIGTNGAVGVWVWGDGQGEVLDLQLVNNPVDYGSSSYVGGAVLDTHNIKVDFTGWKYFELPMRERDVDRNYAWPYGYPPSRWRYSLDRSNIGAINIYLNNLPANGSATCYVGIVKALPVQADTVTSPMTNPSVTIGSSQITFPTTLQAGQYMEFNSMTDCRVYDRNGNQLKSITPTGTLGTLAAGNNSLSFTCTAASGYNARADVVIAGKTTVGTFHAVPVILAAPTNQAVDSGQKATFIVYATGTSSLSYQWQKWNGSVWANVASGTGGTTACYTTPSVDSSYEGQQYRVVISNSYGSLTSNIATLHVNYNQEAWWKLDESGTTTTTASDSSGVNHTATWCGATDVTGVSDDYLAPQWTAGVLNNALSLDGYNDHLETPSTANLKYQGGELTLSAWIYIDSGETTGGKLISKPWNGSGQYNYWLALSAPASGYYNVRFCLQPGIAGGKEIASPTTLAASSWHHVAATATPDGAGAFAMKLYVNGVLVASDTLAWSGSWVPSYGDSNLPLAIGTVYPYGASWAGNTSYSFKGKMDNARMYTHALSPEAIAEQARAPIGFWKLDETTGTATADSAGIGWKTTSNTYTGTWYGATDVTGTSSDYLTPQWTTGMITGAIALDGYNDYVEVPYADTVNKSDTALEYTGSQLTLSAWIYIDSGETTGGRLISKPWNGSGQYNYSLSLSAPASGYYNVRFCLQPGTAGGKEIASPTTLAASSWHHVAATAAPDGAGAFAMKLYVDGVLVTSDTLAWSGSWVPSYGDSNLPLAIGTLYPYGASWIGNTGYSFRGNMDEVRLYEHALTTAEVKTLAVDPPPLVGSGTPPTVQSVTINDGNVQRSKVNSLTVTFSDIVTIDPDAFEVLKRGSGGGLVALAMSSLVLNGRTVVTSTFSGGLTQFSSLTDGEYQLTIHDDKIRNSVTLVALDGDGDGLAGGNRVFGDRLSDAFFRLYGDSDGDRDVDNLDFVRFRTTMNKTSAQAGFLSYFDLDDDGDVDNLDFARFRVQIHKTR